MLIKEKLGSLATIRSDGRSIDRMPVEWYETGKRILHKKTGSGREVMLKFLAESPNLQQDDVLFADDTCLVVVEVLACQAIVLKPETMCQMAYACYEIGNKHLPLFFEDDCLLIPHEVPLYQMLQAAGFDPQLENRKLLHPLRTTVSPHSHPYDRKETLFSRIMKLTTAANDQ
jgi:urease accessory protein